MRHNHPLSLYAFIIAAVSIAALNSCAEPKTPPLGNYNGDPLGPVRVTPTATPTPASAESTPNWRPPAEVKFDYDVSLAKPYTVIRSKDSMWDNEPALEVDISSRATTAEERAQTVMRAAMELRAKPNHQTVTVCQQPDGPPAYGFQYAFARLTTQGFDVVNSTGQQPSTRDIQMAQLWYANKDKFADDKDMRRYIAKQMNLKPSQVSLDEAYLLRRTIQYYIPRKSN